jgi:hypothetical protein
MLSQINRVCKELHYWVAEGNPTPFNSLREVMHLASAVALATGSAPKAMWKVGGYEELTVDGTTITMAELRAFIRNLICDASNLLDDLLMGMARRTDSDLPLHDNLSNKDVGYSFLTDRRNANFDSVTQLFKQAHLWSRYVDGITDGKLRWKVSPCLAYLAKCETLQELLFVLIHVTSGQPARASELATFKICNTDHRIRNVYLVHGEVVIIQHYTKSNSQTGHDDFIPRLLPKEVGQLLINYLMAVRPMERLFAMATWMDEQAAGALFTHLFVANERQTSGKDLRLAFEQQTSKAFQEKFPISKYRHMAIAIDRAHVRNPEVNLDHIGDKQAAHSSKTAERIYAREEGLLGLIDGGTITKFSNVSTSALSQ